ncbi:MAG: CPBP family intramembrane metalloprotease [Saprospiraceae bacterium]|nr:CPBP family intramembrane metalloprotease [Saprospiraceae bacterium]
MEMDFQSLPRFVDYLYFFILFPTIIATFDLVIKKSNAIIESLAIPNFIIPKTNKEFILFVFFILVGIIFEEIVMRYYLFHYLNKLFYINGDTLILFATLIVGLGHLYYNTKGLILAIIGHLVLSKIYLITDSIPTTIFLHFIMNLSIVLGVIKMNYLTKSKTT